MGRVRRWLAEHAIKIRLSEYLEQLIETISAGQVFPFNHPVIPKNIIT